MNGSASPRRTVEDLVREALRVNAQREHAAGCTGCSCGKYESVKAYEVLAQLSALDGALREHRRERGQPEQRNGDRRREHWLQNVVIVTEVDGHSPV